MLALVLGGALAFMSFEDSLIFYPIRFPGGAWEHGDARIADRWVVAEDGVRLHAWMCTPARDDAASLPLIIYMHGNAGNVSHRVPILEEMMALPARVLILDYRGYGRSDGKPSEEGLRRDARAAWALATGELAVPPGRIVLYGESLGGAVAVHLAGESTAAGLAGLVVQSSFTSIRDMASAVMPFVPRLLVRNRFDSLAAMARVRCPLLIIHGREDEMIPFAMGKQLYDAGPPPKRFVEIPDGGHNEIWDSGAAPLRQALRSFLRDYAGGI